MSGGVAGPVAFYFPSPLIAELFFRLLTFVLPVLAT